MHANQHGMQSVCLCCHIFHARSLIKMTIRAMDAYRNSIYSANNLRIYMFNAVCLARSLTKMTILFDKNDNFSAIGPLPKCRRVVAQAVQSPAQCFGEVGVGFEVGVVLVMALALILVCRHDCSCWSREHVLVIKYKIVINNEIDKTLKNEHLTSQCAHTLRQTRGVPL